MSEDKVGFAVRPHVHEVSSQTDETDPSLQPKPQFLTGRLPSAAGKSLLHDVNELDSDRGSEPISFWTNAHDHQLFAAISSIANARALVEPDGIEPTT